MTNIYKKCVMTGLFMVISFLYSCENNTPHHGLPLGENTPALEYDHFPSRLYTFIWRNWNLVAPERMAQTIGCEEFQILEIAESMGLDSPSPILEDYKTQNGQVLTDQLSTYLIPTIWDIPEKVETVLVEVKDPNGPWGARGVGELPYLPVAPAIVSAIHDATGVWIDELPLTPERVLRALGKI